MTTLDDLSGKLFASVPEVADIIGRDERTVRKCAESGLIPGQKLGANWSIPVAWLRQQAGLPGPTPATAAPDMDELADQVAARVLARLGRLLAQASKDAAASGVAGMDTAVPARLGSDGQCQVLHAEARHCQAGRGARNPRR